MGSKKIGLRCPVFFGEPATMCQHYTTRTRPVESGGNVGAVLRTDSDTLRCLGLLPKYEARNNGDESVSHLGRYRLRQFRTIGPPRLIALSPARRIGVHCVPF